MAEPEITGFKMLENAPYELPDPKAIIGAHIVGIREQEKIFGPVFSTRLIKHALKFVAQKIGEEPPQNIKTLDQLAEYLISKIDKYPTPYCAIMYAQYKTENFFQGQTGAAIRVAEMGFHRKFGKSQIGEERNVDLDDIMSKLRQTSIALKLSPKEFGYKTNEDESVDWILPNCYYRDGCQQAFDDGLLKRPDGRLHCNLGSSLCQYFKVVTGYEWDYDCLEFDKPQCIIRYYIV
nr:hypothetical protein [Candidatus Freyarchaeota archaeon]